MEKIGSEKIYEYLLPKEITTYFEITELKEEEGNLIILIDEKNEIPIEYKGQKLESKGFYPCSRLEDFPIREYKVYLEVRRRKWKNLQTGKIVRRDWELTAKGTSYTKEFGNFLKEMARHTTSKCK